MTTSRIHNRNPVIDFVTNETLLYVIKRLLQGLLTLLLVSALSFAIIQFAPGNFCETLRQNPKVSQTTVTDCIARFGLDKPPVERYWSWLVAVVTQWDFGLSVQYNRPVSELLQERIFNTLLLAISSLIVTWAIAIPLGIVGAIEQNRVIDKFLRILSYIAQGFPSFVTALLLLIVAQMTAPIFPVGGRTSIDHDRLTWFGKIIDVAWHMILPTIALSITSFAGLQRLMRGQLLDVLRQDYIQTARAKGLPENRVIYVHALRNAINPLVTLLGFEFAALLGGSFITEYFFNFPGLGLLTLDAVRKEDVPLVMGSLVMGAFMLILGNILADLLLKAVDPRIKIEDLR
jgi:peptide/nickel transport system permease protein